MQKLSQFNSDFVLILKSEDRYGLVTLADARYKKWLAARSMIGQTVVEMKMAKKASPVRHHSLWRSLCSSLVFFVELFQRGSFIR
jgi:hypothetical protein